MRRIVLWLASTITVVVLVFGYHTSTNKTLLAGVTNGTSTNGTSSARPSSPSSADSGGPAATRTYTGAVTQTRWGPVQVQVTLRGEKITKVTVLQRPSGNSKDTEINDYALPILVQDTISAQSATIDMVSGATLTSTGYVQSLQSALDEART